MEEKVKYLNISGELKEQLVNCVHKAVCDDILLDYYRSGLTRRKSNSYHVRKWDFIYDNLMNLNSELVTVGYTTRNPWHLAVLFDHTTQTICAVMRENRFRALSGSRQKVHHYVTSLAACFNYDVDNGQYHLEGFEETPNEEIKRSVNKICSDIGILSDCVERFALVLFSEKNNVLTDIKLCAVNSRFEICEAIDLCEYIDIGDEVSAHIDAATETFTDENPTKVKLTTKSRERIKKRNSPSVALLEKTTLQQG